MLRYLALVSLMVFAAASVATSGGLRSYSIDFTYSSQAEPHLGGDEFTIRSVRIDHRANIAEVAEVTAAGRIVSLAYYEASGDGKLPLPTIPAPAAVPSNAPPVVAEGRGPVGVAARGDGRGSMEVRTNEPSDPAVISLDADWNAFDADLRKLAGSKIGIARKGNYVQLRALEAGLSAPSALKLTLNQVKSDPYLTRFFGAPFAFVPFENEDQLAAIDPALLLNAGETRLLSIRGRLYALTRFELR